MFPLWLAVVIIFYILFGYLLWKLINIFHYCDYKMATHCSVLSWKILWTEEPGRLWGPWGRKVRHNWVTNTNINYYSFNTVVSWLVNRKIIEFYITKTTI